MGELIAKLDIFREKGYLYYVKSQEDGRLLVYKAKLMRGGKKKLLELR